MLVGTWVGVAVGGVNVGVGGEDAVGSTDGVIEIVGSMVGSVVGSTVAVCVGRDIEVGVAAAGVDERGVAVAGFGLDVGAIVFVAVATGVGTATAVGDA